MANAAITDILGGAIVDREFCAALLRSPLQAVEQFDLSLDEREAIGSIRASCLEEFAAQLYTWMVAQGNGYGSIRGHEPLPQLRPVSVRAWAGTMLS